MKNSTAFFALSALALSACSRAQAPVLEAAPKPVFQELTEESRLVAVGSMEKLRVDFPAARHPTVTNPTIVETQLWDPYEIRMIPLKRGTATVVVNDTEGRPRRKIHFQVITNDLFQKLTEVRQLLRNVKGVSIEVVGDQIAIDGHIAGEADRNRVLSVHAAYSDMVVNLAVNSENLCVKRLCQQQRYSGLYDPYPASTLPESVTPGTPLSPQTPPMAALDYGDAPAMPVPSDSWGVADPIVKAVREATKNDVPEMTTQQWKDALAELRRSGQDFGPDDPLIKIAKEQIAKGEAADKKKARRKPASTTK